MSGSDNTGTGPQVQARVIIDPSHPEAGDGGVVPPVETRFKPGVSGNPGGRPKGALPRTAFLRAIAKDPDEDGIGAKSAALGARYAALLEALAVCNDPERADRIRGELAELRHTFAEAEGRPTEHVHNTSEGNRTVILRDTAGPPPPLPVEGQDG